jgi:SAM-dependent methyltransferase
LFPFESESFDFVLLTSVFTHMLPTDLDNYLAEVARVLKVNGRCLITAFLLNQESESLIISQTSRLTFPFKVNGICRAKSGKIEEAVSYDEQWILDLYRRNGLAVQSPIHYGSWCERKNYLSFQDIIVATKKERISASKKLRSRFRRSCRFLRPQSLTRIARCSARRLLPTRLKLLLERMFIGPGHTAPSPPASLPRSTGGEGS